MHDDACIFCFEWCLTYNTCMTWQARWQLKRYCRVFLWAQGFGMPCSCPGALIERPFPAAQCCILKETLGAARPLCVNLASGLHILMSHSTEPHFPTYFATQTLNAQLPGSFVPSHLHRGCKLLLLLRSHVVGEPQSTFLLEASCS